VEEEGGYTPFAFVHFAAQEIVHDIEIDVEASPMTCYNLWADPETLQEFIGFMTDYTDLTEKAEEEQAGLDGVTAGVTLMYRFGSYPTLELKFIANITEDVPGEKLAFDTVEGMPVAGAVYFTEEGSSTKVRFHVAYKMPVELGLFEEPIAVRNNVEWHFRNYFATFKQMAESDE